MNNVVDILLVEDNPGDARLTQEAFKESILSHRLHVVRDGEEALAFLYRQGPYANAMRPELILLDLNLPKKDGREVLATIKAHAHLKQIPVVVLTTSKSEKDILQVYQLHANCYITKPLDLNRFLEIVKAVEHFWLQIVKLPHV